MSVSAVAPWCLPRAVDELMERSANMHHVGALMRGGLCANDYFELKCHRHQMDDRAYQPVSTAELTVCMHHAHGHCMGA